MKILMVLTSHDQLGDTGRKTGFWLEEFAAPYYVFKDAGAEIVVASPKGGQPPLDPKSDRCADQGDRTLQADPGGAEDFATSQKLPECPSRRLRYDFYPGRPRPAVGSGGGSEIQRLIEKFYKAGKPVAALPRPGASATRAVLGCAAGEWQARDRLFDSEEKEVRLTDVVPFLVEDELKRLGGLFEKAPKNWEPFVNTDGRLVTGQNPASSTAARKPCWRCFRRCSPPRPTPPTQPDRQRRARRVTVGLHSYTACSRPILFHKPRAPVRKSTTSRQHGELRRYSVECHTITLGWHSGSRMATRASTSPTCSRSANPATAANRS